MLASVLHLHGSATGGRRGQKTVVCFVASDQLRAAKSDRQARDLLANAVTGGVKWAQGRHSFGLSLLSFQSFRNVLEGLVNL